ncbi:cupin domain-containing protein [Nocardia thailandica]|uniref:Cupin domain-containing protein n=1 Tax=Nocardia thailandica TaxID=257275 RepID=A0ABW6PIQ8_9NOCA
MPATFTADITPIDLHNARFTPLVRPGTGSTELCVWRVEVAPGSTGVPHRIHREEAFVMLSGSAVVTIDEERHTLVAGDAAVAPAGSWLGIDNSSAEPAVVLVTAPIGFTGELADGTLVDPPWVH